MTDDDPQPAAPAVVDDSPEDQQAGGLTVEVDDSSSPAARITQLETALAKAEQDKKDSFDKFVRSAADLENYRRRTRRDLDDAKAEARTKVLKEMLPVLDNLERAIAAGSTGTDALLEGVRLVLRQFGHAFERLDVNPVEADGKPFDPNVHEAIGQQESEAAPGTVVSVLQRGYKLGDRLLRPALVVVAKPKAAPEVDSGAPGSEVQG